MEEIAKTIKLHATLAVGACVTVAAFLIAPTGNTDSLQEARNELRNLKEIVSLSRQHRNDVQQDLNRQVIQHLTNAMNPKISLEQVKQDAIESDCPGCAANAPAPATEAPRPANNGVDERPYNTVPPRRTTSDAVKHIITIFEKQSDKTWRSREIDEWNDSLRTATIENKNLLNWGNALPFTTDAPTNVATVHECYIALTQRDASAFAQNVQVFYPNSVDFATKFRTLLSDSEKGFLSEWRIDRAPLQNPNQPLLTARLECTFKEGGNTRTICVFVTGQWRCSSCNSIQVKPFVEWIEENHPETISKVRDPFSGEWMPKSRKVWSEVFSKHIDEAISHLDLRISKDTERMTVLGFSASIASAAVLFPIAIAALFMLNCVQLRFLEKNIRNVDECLKVQYQWHGFFTDSFSLTVTLFLLAVFPFAVDLWLLVRFALNIAHYTNWRDYAATALVILLGAFMSVMVAVHWFWLMMAIKKIGEKSAAQSASP